MRRLLVALFVFCLVAVACGNHGSTNLDQVWQDATPNQVWEFRHNHEVSTAYSAGAWRDAPNIYVRGDVTSGNSWDLFYTSACFTVGHNDVGLNHDPAHAEQLYATECFSTFEKNDANFYYSIHSFLHEEGHLDILESWWEYQPLGYSTQPRPLIEYHDADNGNPSVDGVKVCGRTTAGVKFSGCFGV